MFAPDEITQTTETLEQLPRILGRRSAPTGKRQRIIEDRQTDALPPLTLESPNVKVARRQVTQLRKENRHLRAALDGQLAEMQKVLSEYTQLRSEIAVIHESHQQDLASYQTQLQELPNERNQLGETQQALEEHYQALQKSFQDMVQEEAHKLMQEAAATALQSPDNAPLLVQGVVKTIELHLRQEEDKRLIEALYLKREVQRMASFLEQERQQILQDQQQLLSFQLRVREQANIRQKLLEERLYTRWKLISVVTSFSLLALFIVLEFVCLALFHTRVVGSVALSIIIPIVICILLRIVLAAPLGLLKTMYMSTPHKRRVKSQT